MVWLPPIPKTKKELQNIIATERNRYRDALDKIAKARLEPGHLYEQALMLQKIADKALEKRIDCPSCEEGHFVTKMEIDADCC